jgi:hypothetical protein
MKPDEFYGDATEVTNELLRWKELANRRLNDWETNLIRIIRQVKDMKLQEVNQLVDVQRDLMLQGQRGNAQDVITYILRTLIGFKDTDNATYSKLLASIGILCETE